MKRLRWLTPFLLVFLFLIPMASAQPRDVSEDKELAKLFEKKTKNLSRKRIETIERLIQDLSTQHPEERQASREKLLEFGQASTPFLLREISSSSHNRARSALVALAMIKDPESRPYLEAALTEPRYLVTTFAALALGKLAEPSSAKPLMSIVLDVSSREAFDRAAAAIALARIGEGPDPTPLIRLLENEDEIKVVSAILLALGKLRAVSAYDEVVARAHSRVDRIRRAAILALGDFADQRSLPFLLDRLKRDEDEKSIQFTCGALSAFPTPEVAEAILATLSRTEITDDTRAVALRALGSQKADARIEKVLLRHATDANRESIVRQAAVASLHPYGGEAVIKALTGLLRDEDPKLRSSAAILLGFHDAKAAHPRLIRLLASEDQGLVESCAIALVNLIGKEAKPHLETVRPEHPAYRFVRDVRASFERADFQAYLKGWLDLWVESLGGRSDGLIRNLSNEQLHHLFELERRLTKSGRTPGERPRLPKTLSTAQQDLLLWIEAEPYF